MTTTHYEFQRVKGGWQIIRVTRTTRTPSEWAIEAGDDGMPVQMRWLGTQDSVTEEHRYPMLGVFKRKRTARLWAEAMD